MTSKPGEQSSTGSQLPEPPAPVQPFNWDVIATVGEASTTTLKSTLTALRSLEEALSAVPAIPKPEVPA